MKFILIIFLYSFSLLAQSVELKWDLIGDKSLLEISRDKSFNKIYTKKIITKNSYIFKTNKSGKFYWRVSQYWNDGTIGEKSKVGFIIVTPKIKNVKIKKFKISKKQFVLNKSAPEPFHYCIEDEEGSKFKIKRKYRFRKKKKIYRAKLYLCLGQEKVKELANLSYKFPIIRNKNIIAKNNSKKVKKAQSLAQKSQKKLSSKNDANDNFETKHNFGLFYMYSRGTFSDDSTSLGIELNQDSPLTIGLSHIAQMRYFDLSSSVYFSTLDGVESDGSDLLPLNTSI